MHAVVKTRDGVEMLLWLCLGFQKNLSDVFSLVRGGMMKRDDSIQYVH